jgi:hypothetical protein
MAYPKNSKSALLALAVSGGLWAWQNRAKISSWVNDQMSQRQTPQGSYTGATRRINESELESPRPVTVLGDEGRTSGL